MGDQTDYLAQLMNSEHAGKIFDIDLSQNPDSNLANSIQQICQAEFGRMLSKEGGFAGMVKGAYNKAWKEGRETLIEDVSSEIADAIKVEMTNYLLDCIEQKINERIQPRTNMDVLRERVESFTLISEQA